MVPGLSYLTWYQVYFTLHGTRFILPYIVPGLFYLTWYQVYLTLHRTRFILPYMVPGLSYLKWYQVYLTLHGTRFILPYIVPGLFYLTLYQVYLTLHGTRYTDGNKVRVEEQWRLNDYCRKLLIGGIVRAAILPWAILTKAHRATVSMMGKGCIVARGMCLRCFLFLLSN